MYYREYYPHGVTLKMTARRILGRDHFLRHYKPVEMCEWRAGEVLYTVVCTVTFTASTVSAGVHGGLFNI